MLSKPRKYFRQLLQIFLMTGDRDDYVVDIHVYTGNTLKDVVEQALEIGG